MNRPHRRDHNAVPLGRRVAELRARRAMSQQAFADRLGQSKSWVDKVERGVRKLDRYSVIREIADVLRLDPAVLLGSRQPSPTTTPGPGGIDASDERATAHRRVDQPRRRAMTHGEKPRLTSALYLARHDIVPT
ncbi:hypothetical protein GCM10011608_41070 [Micromonospora sonchi]|uniref:HTH cro/C1-type domain-containing protein n=1 Tax=Micromonospora sonchi TaxID=1763543 RepID=A0A917U1K5_9ACTN|nr:hypothetical protein GCM10011608_41070 [Micromonospora sonchi]